MSTHPYRYRPEAATHDWLTPPEIVHALGNFDLDPCACRTQPWATADRMISPPSDGLAQPWHGRVWLNPPYGRHTAAWLKRMSEHGNGIALVFARTETDMFQKYVWSSAHAVFFLAKRPHFYRPDGLRAKGNSGGPMVLIAYGYRDVLAIQLSGLGGTLVAPIRYQSN